MTSCECSLYRQNSVCQFTCVHIFWTLKNWWRHLYGVTGIWLKKSEQMKTQCGNLQCSRARSMPSSPRRRKAVLAAWRHRRCRWSNPRGRPDPWRYILFLLQLHFPHSGHSGLEDKGLLVTEEFLDLSNEVKMRETAGSSCSSKRHSTTAIAVLASPSRSPLNTAGIYLSQLSRQLRLLRRQWKKTHILDAGAWVLPLITYR